MEWTALAAGDIVDGITNKTPGPCGDHAEQLTKHSDCKIAQQNNNLL